MTRPYPVFRKENIPAYFAVVVVWAMLSIVLAAVLRSATSAAFGVILVWSFVAVMAGMMIMFGASLINLQKLGPGFRRLADGAQDPAIPPVWCPVLTAATNAAMELAHATQSRPASSVRPHLALYASSLASTVPFYEALFGVPARRPRPAYAEIEIGDPPLTLVLQEVAQSQPGSVNHLGLRFSSREGLDSAAERLKLAGWSARTDLSVTCGVVSCRPRQITTWVTAPDGTRWELYVEEQQPSTTNQPHQEDSTP